MAQMKRSDHCRRWNCFNSHFSTSLNASTLYLPHQSWTHCCQSSQECPSLCKVCFYLILKGYDLTCNRNKDQILARRHDHRVRSGYINNCLYSIKLEHWLFLYLVKIQNNLRKPLKTWNCSGRMSPSLTDPQLLKPLAQWPRKRILSHKISVSPSARLRS